MKRENWLLLEPGDTIIGKLSNNEFSIVARGHFDHEFELDNGALVYRWEEWSLTPKTRERLREGDRPPLIPSEDETLSKSEWVVQYLSGYFSTHHEDRDKLPLDIQAALKEAQRKVSMGTLCYPSPKAEAPAVECHLCGTVGEHACRDHSAGDTVEVTGPDNAGATDCVGGTSKIARCHPDGYYQLEWGGVYFPASSLRRVHPAADYVAGQLCEVHMGGKTWAEGRYAGAAKGNIGIHLVAMPDGEQRIVQFAADIRPCPASAGCVVMDVQTGEYGICFAAGSGLDVSFRKIVDCYDPARHAVMLTPRQPAAPAEQPAPAADLRREIEAALDRLSGTCGFGGGWAYALKVVSDAIIAAAAVPPVARPGDVESYAYDIGYNAGQDSILAKMLAALTQGGK